MFKSVFFFLGKSFFGRKVILKPRTNRGSVQKVSMICVFWNVIARNCLLEEICVVCVNLRRFLSARASGISSSFSKCFLSFFYLCKVSWMFLIEVVTHFITFFQGLYGLSNVISLLLNSR